MHNRWFWGILIVAFIVRLVFAWMQTDLANSSDEGEWDHMGWAFARLGVLHPDTGVYRPPLYGLFLACSYKIFGHDLFAVRLLQCLIGTTTCGLFYLLGQRLNTSKTGLIAAGLSAVYPFFVFFSGILMAETLLIFLSTLCLVFYGFFCDRVHVKYAILLGLFVGLSALCKPILLPWLPVALWWWWRFSSLCVAKKMVRIGLLFATVFCVVMPWTWRNQVISGHWVPIAANTGINFMIGAMPESRGRYQNDIDYLAIYRTVAGTSDFVLGDQQVMRVVWGWIVNDPMQFLFLGVQKLFWFWCPLLPEESVFRNVLALCFGGPLLLLGFVGAFQLRLKPEGVAICILMITMSLLHGVFFAHVRFRLPIDGVLCATAAYVLENVWQTWRMRFDS